MLSLSTGIEAALFVQGPDLLASLSNNDPARGTEMRQAEDALVHLREKVPSAFSGAQEAKVSRAGFGYSSCGLLRSGCRCRLHFQCHMQATRV